jgi:hypothetical protein
VTKNNHALRTLVSIRVCELGLEILRLKQTAHCHVVCFVVDVSFVVRCRLCLEKMIENRSLMFSFSGVILQWLRAVSSISHQ